MSSIYLTSLYDTQATSPTTAVAMPSQTLVSAQSNAAAAARAQIQNISANLTALTGDVSSLSTRSTTYGTLIAALQDYGSVMAQLTDSSVAAGMSATSSNAAISVAVGSNAEPGTTTVSVSQLAQAQQNRSSSVASATQAANFGNGTLAIAAGNQAAVSVNVSDSMSLNDLAQAINASNAGVSATVASDQSGAYLLVTGSSTGADAQVSYTENGTSTGLAANQQQAATDLQGSANGVAFTQGSNVASNIIAGTTLTISSTFSNATVTLSASSDAAAASVQAFVSAYNTVWAALNTAQASQTDYGVLDTLRGQLQNLVTQASSGASGTYAALSQVGVKTGADGTLSIDNAALSQASLTDAMSVAALFSGVQSGSNGLAHDLQQVALSYAAPGTGIMSQNQYGLQAQTARVGQDVLDESNYVDAMTQVINDQNTQIQVRLSNMTLDALLVQVLPVSAD